MKNMKKLFAITLMLLSVFFFACEDDAPEPLSPENAKVELNDLSTQMSTDFANMQETEGMTAMGVLMDMPDPFTEIGKTSARTAVISNIYESLIPFTKEIKTKAVYKSEVFDFNTYKGTYTWNNVAQLWEITLGGNKIVINFPADKENMGDINATLTISNYQEDANNNPTAISADLVVDDIKVVEIIFSATWNIDEPTSLDVSIYLKPFTFSGGFDQTSTSATANFSIKYESTKIFGTNLNVTFTDNTKEVIKKVSGYIQYRDIKISVAVNVTNIMAIIQQMDGGAYTTVDEVFKAVNKEIDAKITKNGALIAKIELAENTIANSELPFVVVLKFSDGSIEPAQPYFENFIASLEELFGFLDDFYGGGK